MSDDLADLVAFAVRTRSLAARNLLAEAGTGGAATLPELIGAARARRRGWLRRLRDRLRPAALAGLARTIALQDLLEHDRTDALALYDLIRTELGGRAVPVSQRGLHLQLALLAGDERRVRALLRRYLWMDPWARTEIRLDLGNPFRRPGRPLRPWLRRFGAGLPGPAIELDDRADGAPFDRLRTAPAPAVDRPERISVIVTAYRPDQGLLTAVRSITAQSWRNLEVIVVDDASPPEFDDVLRRAVASDPRVRLVRQAENAGTYVARNAGLDAATGEFVTFQDSDDWSHPRRLELQVAPLLADPGLVASTSNGRRVSEDLALTRLGKRGGKLNPSALLIRRAAVLERVGYLDDVRKGADSEYICRIQAAFGAAAVRHLDGQPLALIRLSAGSLSRAEIAPYWIHPARAVYRSGYALWHARIARGQASPYLPRTLGERPFPAPDHLRRRAGEPAPLRAYDVVVAADWRYADGPQRSALAEIGALAGRGLRVAILHLESGRRPVRDRRPLHASAQALVNAGRIDQVALTDPVAAELLIIRQSEVLEHPPAEDVGVRARTVLVVADQAPEVGFCAAAAQCLFGETVRWCPTEPAVRVALRRHAPDLPLTDFDLPIVGVAGSAARRGPMPRAPIVGTDLSDGAGLGVLAGLGRFDMRIRGVAGRQPAARLVYRAEEVEPAVFLGQLDFYLHFPEQPAVATFSRAALDAAAYGCVVVMDERHAATHGETAVYCAPEQVPELLERYRTQPLLAAEQRRRAGRALAAAYDPRLFADRIAGLLVTESAVPR